MSNRITVPAVAALAMFLTPTQAAAAEQQDETTTSDELTADLDVTAEGERYDRQASVSIGAMLVDNSSDSSKLNEYRDLRSGLYLDRLFYSIDDAVTGRFLDFTGNRLTRDDADARLEFGSFGGPDRERTRGWTIDAKFNRTPHLLSNSARTPYQYLGNGRYQVDRSIIDRIQISNIDDARSWTRPNLGPGLAGEDLRIAQVVSESVRPIDLGIQRDTGEVGFNWLFSERTKARVEFKRDDRDGSLLAGMSIGDRPPRTTNVQLPEPIDQTTYDFKLAIEHVGRGFHADAAYTYSRFNNAIDTLSWNSLLYAPGFFTPGATDYDNVRRPSTTFHATNGAIALAPDNTAEQFVLNGGLNLPMRSTLSATIAWGNMRQDEALLPFATSDFGGRQTPGVLPRSTADAEIDTTMFNIAYAINPLSRLNMRFFYRMYDLDNKTERMAWFGNVADTSSRPIFSARYNIAYDIKQQNSGADVSWFMGRAGTLGLNLEHERKERPQREVLVTGEDIYRLTYRVRPFERATFTAKLGRGNRDGSPYNGEIVDQTYAYNPALVPNDPNNPLWGFGDHPGLRRFDVTERDHEQLDLTFWYAATERFDTRVSYRDRSNDYDSPMVSVINVWDPTRSAFVDAPVDPTQLGLLRDEAKQLSLDFNYVANEGLSLNAFLSREMMEFDQRGRYLDENNRLFGATNRIANGVMDWQNGDGRYLWNAYMEDRTNTLGLGLAYAPEGAGYEFNAGFTHSRGKVMIEYVPGARLFEDDTAAGYSYSEWTSPPDVSFKTNALTLDYSREFGEQWTIGLRYLYEVYRVTDWQQEGNVAGHQIPVNPWFIADLDPETAGTSQDRAGSRLIRLGDVLAPDYDAHVGLVTLTYRW